MRAAGSAAAILSILAAAGCHDDDTLIGPSASRLEAPDQLRPTVEFVFFRRFDLDVGVVGPVRPGSPIEIMTSVRANLPTPDAELKIVLPEVEAARMSEWGPGFRVPVGVHLPPLARRQISLTAGQVLRENAIIIIPAPGYYRVVVTARSVSDDPAVMDGRPVNNLAVREVWLWLDPMGGRVTDQLDRTLFPRGAVREPGPFRIRRGPGQGGQGAAMAPALDASPSTFSAEVIGHLWEALYFNDDSDVYEPVVNSRWWAVFYNNVDEDVFWPSGYTDAAGRFLVDCAAGGAGWGFYNGAVELNDDHIDLLSGDATFSGDVALRCGNTIPYQTFALSMEGRVYANMTGTASKGRSRFGRTRPKLAVHLNRNSSRSSYDPNADRVTIGALSGADDVWGTAGIFVQAHEYGHAYQYRGIEPWRTYSCTNNEHFWTETENLSCAFVEGFADFLAMWVEGDRIVTLPFGGDYGLENNVDEFGRATNPPANGDGVRVEAAVAAFLYDLVDGDTEPDSPSNTAGPAESFDAATASAGWLADVLQYCSLLLWPNTLRRLDGADELVYCLEKSLSAYSEASQFSSAWRQYHAVGSERELPTFDQAMIRRLWKYNMYGVL